MNRFTPSSPAARRARPRWRTALTAALVALLLTLGGVVLVACGEEAPSGGETTAATGLQSTTPPADGAVDEITWNLGYGEPTTVDPLKAGDYGPCFIASQMHDTLVRYTPDWELQPCIAESWEQVDDLTLVYAIRQDATFWDGSPVTVDDVLFSMKRHMDPETGSIWAAFYSYVDSIEQTGDWEITVKFNKPDELFNKEMGTVGGAIVKKDYVEKVGEAKYGSGENVMGSGPYKMVSWKPGEEIVLEANPDYWDAALAPKVSRVRVTFISDTSTVTSAMLSGEIDGAYGIPATNIPALESAPGTIYYGPSLTVVEVVPTNGDTPMGDPNDPDVRTALSMAIDRQAIVDSVFNGEAVLNKTFTPPSAWDPEALDVYEAAYAEIPGDEPNVEGAKALLEGKEGLDKPLVMALAAGVEEELRVSSIVQQAAKDIGITIKLKPLQVIDLANVFYVPEYRKGIDLVMTWGWLDIPDPLDYTSLFFGEGALFNWIDYRNTEVEGMLDEARQTFDPTTRAELFTDAQAIYTQDTVVIPLVNPYQTLYMNQRISGAPCSFAYMWIPGLAMIGGTE
jgi:peptide/nickel transport system substrate-binding protein